MADLETRIWILNQIPGPARVLRVNPSTTRKALYKKELIKHLQETFSLEYYTNVTDYVTQQA